MNEQRFARLLRGHANADLSAAETAELRRLAATDPARTETVRTTDAALELFAGERELCAAVLAEPPLADEAGEEFERLQQRAAQEEADLRAKMLHRPVPMVATVRARRPLLRPVLLVAAAAAIVAIALQFGSGPGPALLPQKPDNLHAGGAINLVLLDAELSAAQRELSWAAVPGAEGYDVVVADAAGNVVLRRDVAARRSTTWELTTDDFASLRAASGPVRIRVVALDGAGIPIGSSGERVLRLR